MNIFYLDPDPQTCAQYHCDKHVVKMILESAQLLSTAHHVLSSTTPIGVYKKTHVNHPSSIWCRTTDKNYLWLFNLFRFLSEEYTYRYGKTHLSWLKLGDLLSSAPNNIPTGNLTGILMAMPESCKISSDPVICYRHYYATQKTNLLTYTKRDKPLWLT